MTISGCYTFRAPEYSCQGQCPPGLLLAKDGAQWGSRDESVFPNARLLLFCSKAPYWPGQDFPKDAGPVFNVLSLHPNLTPVPALRQ